MGWGTPRAPDGGGSRCCAAGRHPGGAGWGPAQHRAPAALCSVLLLPYFLLFYWRDALPASPIAELTCLGLSGGGWSPDTCGMLPAAAPPPAAGTIPCWHLWGFPGGLPTGSISPAAPCPHQHPGERGLQGRVGKNGMARAGGATALRGGKGRDEARSTGPCGAGGDLPGGAATTTPGPLGARCGAAQDPQAAPHPPWGCRHPVPRLGWEIGKAFLVPSWASPPGLQPSALAHLGSGSSRGGGGRTSGASAGVGRAPGPPVGSVTAPGDAPKALERRWGHWVRLRSWHTLGTDPPCVGGAPVPASEGGAQPKPLGEPPPSPPKKK